MLSEVIDFTTVFFAALSGLFQGFVILAKGIVQNPVLLCLAILGIIKTLLGKRR